MKSNLDNEGKPLSSHDIKTGGTIGKSGKEQTLPSVHNTVGIYHREFSYLAMGRSSLPFPLQQMCGKHGKRGRRESAEFGLI